jgi:ABC-2 type transport system ATP-binding protein
MVSSLPTSIDGPELVVSTRGLTKRFGDQVALNALALQVPAGAVYLLVGPNGAGKSTTIKILLDLVSADAGRAELFGLDCRTHGDRVRANIGYVAEQTDWGYGWMRVGQLLEHHAAFFPTWDRVYASRLIELFELRPERQMRTLSKGQARRIHLALALAHRPPLLLLDEPLDGLDPFMRDETLGILAEHLDESPTTVVLSTHHVEEVERLADHIGVLRNGELRAQLSSEQLRVGLRQYRMELPDRWSAPNALNGNVLRRAGSGREVQWTVWGDEAAVTQTLAASGAMVRDAAALTLSDAVLALLNPKG